MLRHHGRGTMDMSWGTMDVLMVPIIAINVHVPRLRKIYMFLNHTIPKMQISTIRSLFFISHGTINNVLIDTGIDICWIFFKLLYCIPVKH